jgi:hypothetical protein
MFDRSDGIMLPNLLDTATSIAVYRMSADYFAGMTSGDFHFSSSNSDFGQ